MKNHYSHSTTEHDPVRRTKQSTVPYSVLGGLSQWYEATFVADDHWVVSNPLEAGAQLP